MIAPNNSSVDVTALMQRVREEAAAMRSREANGEAGVPLGLPAAESLTGDQVVDLSRHVIIGSLIEDAARMSRPRTALPSRLQRMPLKIGAPLFAFALRILRYIFKDQLHVNASTQQAMRELLRFATTIGGHVAQMSNIARDQRNVARHMATLSARLDASEQRAMELLDLHRLIEGRIGAIEQAMTVSATRIDALETANTFMAHRIGRFEVADARAGLADASVAENRREISAERERALRSEAALRSELTAYRNTLAAASSAVPGAVAPSAMPPGAYAGVHLAISDRFRGDSADIVKQLEAYVDIVRAEGAVDADHPLVDIGSGRGEFLEICRTGTLPSYGIELDAFLAERARTDGLDVRQGDGIAALREAGDATIGAVTAFHVIEHLPFDALLGFFDESLRALVPGGVIICETPNPANVTVGATNFYLDPTHLHPLPAPLVALLLEVRGFTDVRIVELQPNDAMKIDEDTEAARRINGFFYNAQNYAAIARKPGASN